jgi:hypothetical protein
MIRSNNALALLSMVLLCFVALYGPSPVHAAVLPVLSRGAEEIEARDLMAARMDPDFVARRSIAQHAFELATDLECGGAEDSSKKTTSTTTKHTSTSTKKATSTSTKHTSTSTKKSSTTNAFSTVKAASTTSSVSSTITKAATTTSTTVATKTITTTTMATTTVAQPIYTSWTGANNIVLTSNDASYGADEVMDDLNQILDWAEDTDNVNSAQKQEIVAALLSASARYYPDLPTKVVVRIMLADIRQESDFNVDEVSGARLDSGTSWGLLQVSPGDGSLELQLFQQHCNVVTHNFTYGMPDAIRAGVKGPLVDYSTGEMMDLSSLTNDDLFRPWINIHVAMWIQSNLARSSSQDPYDWEALNSYSWSLKTSVLNGNVNAVALKYNKLLAGAAVPTTIRTALGSWVAGPAVDDGGYLTSGDDISVDYLNAIMRGVRELYGVSSAADMPKAWLDTYTLYPGLIDYVP